MKSGPSIIVMLLAAFFVTAAGNAEVIEKSRRIEGTNVHYKVVLQKNSLDVHGVKLVLGDSTIDRPTSRSKAQ